MQIAAENVAALCIAQLQKSPLAQVQYFTS